MSTIAQHAKAIFLEAVEEHSPDEWPEFLDEACGDDKELRQRVEGLLQAHAEKDSLFDRMEPTIAPRSPAKGIGETIGPYKLLQQIGEGGMGIVYLAERQQPVKQRVALKVVKQGMDSKQFIARFEAERQALAMMDHPNIAKVLDAGCTDNGRPYFVMELVKGIPISEFCDENRLTTRDRIQLFVQVCQAVHHAHQKGIIHRDIKPSNVLVALYDQKPVPKVIDFGVAKATNQQLTEKTLFTEVGSILGTWEYMSPEQAVLNQLDVDTRTDVYSLGVMLYELLTGETPLDRQRLREAQIMETLRIIREEEPPKPSTRISSLGQRATAMAAYRKTKPDSLASELRGDLDWIVMKALAKERARRYDSASRLSEDIERFLKHELVEARPPSMWYQLQKFCKRNKALAASVIAIMVALSCGLAVATWGIYQAKQQEHRAMSLLQQGNDLVIQQALMQAFAGQVDEVAKTVSEYRELFGNHEAWPSVLEAAAYLHKGDYETAQGILKPIVDQETTNIPAIALWSTSHLHQGKWVAAMEAGNRLRKAEPTKGKQRDLDQLFLGYGLIFLDSPRAEELLSDVLTRHPTWLVCHSVLADIRIHLGAYNEDRELVEEARRKATATMEFVQDNPFTLNVNLYARRCLIEFHQAAGLDYSELQHSGDTIADRLSQYPDYLLGCAMRAQYFDAVGQWKTAEATWKQVLEKGAEMWRWTAVGRLYRDRSSEEMLSLLDSLPSIQGDRWVRAARAYVLADIPGGKKKAMAIFQELYADKNAALADRYNDLHIPLLLGEKDVARTAAEKWFKEWEAGRPQSRRAMSEFSEERLLHIIATGEVPDVDGLNRFDSALVSHILGLMALADGRREDAEQHFELSIEKPYVNIDHFWGETFLKHLRTDSSWPREHRGLVADGAMNDQ